jgi:hypothetical protein
MSYQELKKFANVFSARLEQRRNMAPVPNLDNLDVQTYTKELGVIGQMATTRSALYSVEKQMWGDRKNRKQNEYYAQLVLTDLLDLSTRFARSVLPANAITAEMPRDLLTPGVLSALQETDVVKKYLPPVSAPHRKVG